VVPLEHRVGERGDHPLAGSVRVPRRGLVQHLPKEAVVFVRRGPDVHDVPRAMRPRMATLAQSRLVSLVGAIGVRSRVEDASCATDRKRASRTRVASCTR
jgi:hypothetical protein